jgi:hypothetical protein
VKCRFSTPVQNGTGAQISFCNMGTVSFHWTKSGRGMTLTLHPLLVSRSRKIKTIYLLSLWTVRHVQSLNACKKLHCTFTNIRFHIKPYSIPSIQYTVYPSGKTDRTSKRRTYIEADGQREKCKEAFPGKCEMRLGVFHSHTHRHPRKRSSSLFSDLLNVRC